MRQQQHLDFSLSETIAVSRYPNFMSRIVAPLGLILSLCLGACQSSRVKEFEQVHSGMSKSEVLSAIGGPVRTQRWHGRDRWEYRMYGSLNGEAAKEIVREVHFEDGKATYVGNAIKPAISADEQDRLNENYSRDADARDREDVANSREGITVQKFRPVDENGNVTKPPTEK